MSEDQLTQNFTIFIGTKPVNINRPPVTPLVQSLPLRDIDWKTFEHFCCRLISTDAAVIGIPHLYGVPGDTQKGIDIVANKTVNGRTEIWCFQCKNYEYLSPGIFEQAIKDITYKAHKYIFLLASEAQASLRKIEDDYKHKNVELWDVLDISRIVKNNILKELVAEYFHPAWVSVFFIEKFVAEKIEPTFTINGTVYNKGGYPESGTLVKAFISGNTFKGTTDEEGRFAIKTNIKSEYIHVVARNGSQETSSNIELLTWESATSGDTKLYLSSDLEVRGNIKWCGSKDPIENAEITVNIIGTETRSARSNTEGYFNFKLPYHNQYIFEFIVKDAKKHTTNFALDELKQSLNIFLAKNCNYYLSETKIMQIICDDMNIYLTLVPAGKVISGPPEAVEEIDVEEFYISNFPITCLQYSFYLQQNNDASLPKKWSNRFPPPGREDHPVSGISWYEARDFCEWLSTVSGKEYRLPIRHEWELAARGHNDNRLFPWGNDTSMLINTCNFDGDKVLGTTSVDKFPMGRSPFGVWDMVGNVWEWTSSDNGDFYIVKGGSYCDLDDKVNCHSAEKYLPSRRMDNVGFRIATAKGDIICRYL